MHSFRQFWLPTILFYSGVYVAGLLAPTTGLAQVGDPRHISTGAVIPTEGYADQPYIVRTDDGGWLCVVTTGTGAEGAAGQHIVALRSADRGRTWSTPVDIEPSDGPEASYAVALKANSGRIYVFYNHNTDNVREVRREDRGAYQRVDSLGHYVFKFSDDGGRTWSPLRYEVSVREFACDRENVYAGKLRFFWNVGRPLVASDSALLTLHKVGAMGPGFFAQSEGCFLLSHNLLTEADPDKIAFETLPEGDVGLRTPPGGGRIAEEQSVVQLSDGSLYCVYRTVDGWPACAYSRDGGRHWTRPEYAAYQPGGRRIKHPRAANFVWRCAGGKYLYWFHNHGGRFLPLLPEGVSAAFNDRNPAWLAAGTEHDGPDGKMLHWSEPEIVLYDDDPFVRMSYPDLVEDGGRYYLTETQKHIARVHELPGELVEGLFGQESSAVVAQDGLLLESSAADQRPWEVEMPPLPELQRRDYQRRDYGGRDTRASFSVELWLTVADPRPGQRLLDSRDASGKGVLAAVGADRALHFAMSDGRQACFWDSDPDAIVAGKLCHVTVVVDGGPKIITMIVNGRLCDGGEVRQFGWGRYSPTLRAPNPDKVDAAPPRVRVGPDAPGGVQLIRVYGRALRTSEAVGNYRAGPRPVSSEK